MGDVFWDRWSYSPCFPVIARKEARELVLLTSASTNIILADIGPQIFINAYIDFEDFSSVTLSHIPSRFAA